MKNLIWAAALVLANPVWADDVRHPVGDPAVVKQWQTECSACHVAFPPQLLVANDWQKLMSGLDKHYGANAGLDKASADRITAFLMANGNSRKPERHTAASGRITDTAWFQREHHEVPAAIWKDQQVKSPANCAACHPGADKSDYNEHAVRLPRSSGGRKG